MTQTQLNIVLEDDYLLVVDKPAGLLMHPSWLDKHETDTLASRVKQYFVDQGYKGKVHTVHRLDRPTSGLVVIAKQDSVAKALGEQFRNNEVHKVYWAITRGFTPEIFEVNEPITEELDKIADRDASKVREPQPAKTSFKRLGIAELALPVSRYPKSRYSLVECRPVTGRKHQIRKHLKHIRFPILGDTRYGCRHNNKVYTRHFNQPSLALRAISISFVHPVTLNRVSINSGESECWSGWLNTIGWARSSHRF